MDLRCFEKPGPQNFNLYAKQTLLRHMVGNYWFSMKVQIPTVMSTHIPKSRLVIFSVIKP